METSKKHLAIVTSCTENWGGSEELWARAIPYWLEMGYKISVYKWELDKTHPAFIKLADRGVRLFNLATPFSVYKTVIRKVFRKLKLLKGPIPQEAALRLSSLFRQEKPDLVIVSQGINFDGLQLANACLKRDIPYVLVAQKAVDFYWPPNEIRGLMRNVYQRAVKAYFVSVHNKTLTEQQFGVKFSNADVIVNPIKVPRQILPAPDYNNGYRLACIGRYFLLDKGQDILIRILAMPKWKQRPISVSFIGTGADKEGLIEMAALLGVKNISFVEQTDNIEELWKSYHGLVLPSRSEGTPLVLLEAMACGRMAIVSSVGGNAELISDGVTGFIGDPSEIAFDAAMERAWQLKDEWINIGKRGNAFITKTVSYVPEEFFANSIKSIILEN
ncbi:glycosyltransferase [Danxiaibacter flavus]|uniref:Glycosyltransferase n=1 Tax=Danxiaibacter flavus TaxID=3049108 RepID=A0ABV3ZD92_9BACT|nr:glycosyltransferase [Chitinophagaceae bacterium DXS]